MPKCRQSHLGPKLSALHDSIASGINMYLCSSKFSIGLFKGVTILARVLAHKRTGDEQSRIIQKFYKPTSAIYRTEFFK